MSRRGPSHESPYPGPGGRKPGRQSQSLAVRLREADEALAQRRLSAEEHERIVAEIKHEMQRTPLLVPPAVPTGPIEESAIDSRSRPVAPRGEPPERARSSASPESNVRAWSLRRLHVAALLISGGIAAIVAALALALGPELGTPSDVALPDGPSEVYREAVAAPLGRLNSSVRVMKRALAEVSSVDDVRRLSGAATRQGRLASGLESRIKGFPAGAIDEDAQQQLESLIADYRALLGGLSHLQVDRPARSTDQLPSLEGFARGAMDRARRFERLTGLGSISEFRKGALDDLSGVRTVLEAHAASLREQFRRPPVAPVVEPPFATDLGSEISVVGSYCDRSRGAVQDFAYRVNLVDEFGSIVESDVRFESQTQACNQIEFTFPDYFPLGPYSAEFYVENLSTGLEGSSVSGFEVID